VGEVDEPHDTVYHRVAQGDKRVDGPELDAVYELLKEQGLPPPWNEGRSPDDTDRWGKHPPPVRITK